MPVVFDVGKVLVDFSFTEFQNFLIENGAELKGTQEFIERTSLYDFEKGFINEAQYLYLVNSILKKKLLNTEIKNKWENIFIPIERMINFAKEVSEKTPTYLLSNTNPTHWAYLEKNYGITDFVQGFLTSHDAGAMKPENKIYGTFIEKFDLIPEELIFIDDLEANILAAKELGWNVVHHVDIDRTIEEVREFIKF